MPRPPLLPALGCALLFAYPALAAPPAAVSYYRDIRPIFQQHCLGCHQPARQLGGYLMTSVPDMLKPGDRDKPGIVPKRPEMSMLVDQIRVVNGKAEMPKGRDTLTTDQFEKVVAWVAQGAVDDTPAGAAGVTIDADHPPTYPRPPVVTAVAYSPDGSLLAASGYHEVVLHAGDGSKIVGRLVGQSERVQSLAFSPDGKLLAVAGGSPGRFGEVQIWDVAGRRLKLSVSVTFDTLYGVSWSHDGTKVSFGCGDNTVRAIDAASGRQLLQQGTHADWVLGTAFSGTSEYIASVSRDRTMKLTEVVTGRFIDNVTSITPGALKGGLAVVERRPRDTKQMTKVPPDTPGAKPLVYDEMLIGGADGTPRLYKIHRESARVIGDDANKVREYAAINGRVNAGAFSADGTRFAIAGGLDGVGDARVYETESGKQVSALQNVGGPVYALSYRKDGKAVALAGFDGSVRVYEPDSGKLVTEFKAVP